MLLGKQILKPDSSVQIEEKITELIQPKWTDHISFFSIRFQVKTTNSLWVIHWITILRDYLQMIFQKDC